MIDFDWLSISKSNLHPLECIIDSQSKSIIPTNVSAEMGMPQVYIQ